jgi:glycopeptide antibiotics resistance protein
MLAWIQNTVVRWKLFYLYALLLVIVSVLPINGPGTVLNEIFIVSIRLDYLLHCMIYIPVVVFLGIEKKSDFLITPGKTIIWIAVLIIFAAATEWIQYFLTYRAFNINDLISNCLGIMLGVIFTYVVKHIQAVNLT